MNKFNVEDVVLYQNGERFELGIVKEVIPYEQRAYTKQDGLFGKPSGELYEAYKYRVWYHTGDTTALTDECHLRKIVNAYAFTILRKQADADVNAPLTCRRIAAEILSQSELYGDMYYQLEDWLTNKLEGNNPDIPLGIEGEYLRCALRIEVRDMLDDSDKLAVEADEIESIVDSLLEDFSENVLNKEFITETVARFLAGRAYI